MRWYLVVALPIPSRIDSPDTYQQRVQAQRPSEVIQHLMQAIDYHSDVCAFTYSVTEI